MIAPGRCKKHPEWRLKVGEDCPDCLWTDASSPGDKPHNFYNADKALRLTRVAVKAAAITMRSRWWAARIVDIYNNPQNGGGAFSAICEARRYQGDGESEEGRCWPPRAIPVFTEGEMWR